MFEERKVLNCVILKLFKYEGIVHFCKYMSTYSEDGNRVVLTVSEAQVDRCLVRYRLQPKGVCPIWLKQASSRHFTFVQHGATALQSL